MNRQMFSFASLGVLVFFYFMVIPSSTEGRRAMENLVQSRIEAQLGVVLSVPLTCDNISVGTGQALSAAQPGGAAQIFEATVLAPGKIERYGFKHVKRGDVITLQPISDEGLFQVSFEGHSVRLRIDDEGRITRERMQ